MATSLTQNFSKEEFKKNVISNCKSLYRKNIEEANQQEVFQAVSYAVKDIIIDKWIATHKQYEKDDPKMVYYMSIFPVSCSVLALCAVWLIFRGTQGVESSICFGI